MILTAIGLSKSFDGRTLFSDLSFSFSSGILLIDGKSGCGKTTLLRILRQQEDADAGEVFYDTDIRFGYAGQEPSLLYSLSYDENRKKRKAVIDSEREEYIKKILSFSLSDKRLYSVSGGERQKAEIIFALSQDKDIYFLDEPFASLDKQSKQNLSEYLNAFSKEHPLVIINHDETICLRTSGRILFSGGLVKAERETMPKPFAKEKKKIRYRKNSFLAVEDYFRNNRLFCLGKRLLSLLCFVFFGLGTAFLNTDSYNQSQAISVESDPYSYFRIYPKGKTPLSEAYFASGEVHDVLELNGNFGHFDYTKAILIGGFDNDVFLHFAKGSNQDTLFKEGKEIKIEGRDSYYQTKDISKEQLTSYIGNGYKNLTFDLESDSCEILLTGNEFINQILIHGTSSLLVEERNYSLDGIPIIDIEDGSPVRKRGESSVPFSVSGQGSLELAGPFSKDSVSVSENGQTIESNIKATYANDRITLSLNRYKDILLHSTSSPYFQIASKEQTLKKLSGKDTLLIRDIIFCGNDWVKPILFFAFSFLFLALSVFYSFYGVKGIENWKESRKSTLGKNQYSGFNRSALIVSFAELLIPAVLSSILYPTLFLYLSNKAKRNWIYPKGYEVSLGKAYKDVQRVPFAHFSWLYFLIAILFILILAFYWFSRIKKGKADKR